MPRVTCKGEMGVNILGWRVLPLSKGVLDPNGRAQEEMPTEIAYSEQAKRLADLDVLSIEGYVGPAMPPQDVPTIPVSEDEGPEITVTEPLPEVPTRPDGIAAEKARSRRRARVTE